MSGRMRIVVVVANLAVLCLPTNHTLAASEGDFRMPSPWAWRCVSGRCVKEDSSGQVGLTTFNMCKLTCSTEGMLWPRPVSAIIGDQVTPFLPWMMRLQPICQGEVCNLLREAYDIFTDTLHRYHPHYANGKAPWTGPWDATTELQVLQLDVTVASNDTILTLDTDESYDLTVTIGTDLISVIVIAPTYFGARHALETLSQLVEYHETADALMIVPAMVSDGPAFPYRGLLLDTSRNFVSVGALERTLDAMAACKLNTLHWHITDSHSFPLFLDSLPNMAYYGAYSARQVYTPAQVRNLMKYAQVRGVRLLPELDAPAHVGNGWQWGDKEGLGQLAVCVNQEPWQSYCVEPPCGQLNLANPNMYDVLGQIYKELVQLFSPLELFHFGGDEVNLNCWNTTEEIFNFMVDNGYGTNESDYYHQWAVFQGRALELLHEAAGGRDVPGVLWTSHLTKPEYLEYLNPSQYIIQIWTKKNDSSINNLLSRGYRVIFSNYDAWYLDCGMGAWVGEGNNWCSPYKGWQTVYDNSPHDIAFTETGSPHTDLILGGEAALWTEQLWPRGAAIAERLWTNPVTNWKAAEIRFINHRQRMVQRGVQAERIQPQWCHQNEGLCYLSEPLLGCGGT
ncbi:Chitooligosaccharidolytic beta-N-acetylglucosaminidase [Portunus trituberculatus]|uniref:Beta-hexosaminidase n=1 Tax=Portunus trituberculatus TaxID=210409 RepID=A0A5B7CZ84_PORTR|nr:Chitooligosaccharidolytic beta-N-acetylglucosaminidase [Portunus trituberculatus]